MTHIRGRDKFNKIKPIINILINISRLIPKKARKKLFELFRNKKGNTGLLIRYILLTTIVKKCGENVSIHPGVYLFGLDKLSIGNNVSIHPMSYIDANGGVEIGNDVSIAHGVSILSTSHIYEDINIPIKDQGIDSKKTIIEDNVWVGAKASILYGNIVKNGSIIAANTVVTKNIDCNVIVGGVPARTIIERK